MTQDAIRDGEPDIDQTLVRRRTSWSRAPIDGVRGGLIGAAESVPGISGGTIALVVGLYDELVLSAGHVVHAARALVVGLVRRRGTADADGLLLSWLTPTAAAAQAADAHAAAPDAHVAVYVRTSVHPDADARLAAETARYAGFPNYAAHFARLGIDPAATVIDSTTDLRAALEAYENSVDEVVLRAITPTDDTADYLGFVDAVAGARRP